jgi:hypothetical protein
MIDNLSIINDDEPFVCHSQCAMSIRLIPYATATRVSDIVIWIVNVFNYCMCIEFWKLVAISYRPHIQYRLSRIFQSMCGFLNLRLEAWSLKMCSHRIRWHATSYYDDCYIEHFSNPGQNGTKSLKSATFWLLHQLHHYSNRHHSTRPSSVVVRTCDRKLASCQCVLYQATSLKQPVDTVCQWTVELHRDFNFQWFDNAPAMSRWAATLDTSKAINKLLILG